MAQTDWSEQPWFDPAALNYYGEINSRNVHLYFSNSPFFDQTCNNAFLISQASATFTADGFDMIQNRVRFETELRKMAGIEYMVSEEPSIEKQSTNPIWVIKKQEREKVRRKRKEGSKEWEEEVTEVSQVLGTYYVIGSLIYEAPSVEKVLQSKLLAIQNCLTNLLSAATELPLFNSVSGHHYLSQSAMAAKAAKDADRASRMQSRAGSAAPSPPAAQEGPMDPLASGTKPSQDGTNTYDDLHLLAQSFQLSAMYGSEYMDENPLHGEPGSFVFASSTDHLRAVQQAQQAKAKPPTAPAAGSPAASARGSASATPVPAIKTEGIQQARKGSSGGDKSPVSAGPPKLKKKKAMKGTATSPAATSPK